MPSSANSCSNPPRVCGMSFENSSNAVRGPVVGLARPDGPSRQGWALRLPFNAAGALRGLRLLEGIELGEDSVACEFWLRGRGGDETTTGALRGLPATMRYEWLPEDQLRRVGALLVSDRLPVIDWQPLRAWLRVRLPMAQLPADLPPPVLLEFVSS